MAASVEVRPNPGPQEAFLASPADIAIYGGAAGGGKTWALLLDPLRWVRYGTFRALFFRRTYPQIMQAGGAWDKAMELYPLTGARPRRMEWRWPSGARVEFHHLQRETDVYAYDGAEADLVLLDELAHFTARQFWYLERALRGKAPLRAYRRAASNPPGDPDHWLVRLLRWWIADDGFPDPSRAGRLRWFVRDGDELVWADTPEDLSRYGRPLSLAFYPARLTDNPVLMERDPEYEARLRALPRFERERLLHGNWLARPTAGSYFRRSWFGDPLPSPPDDLTRAVRGWDRAATKPSDANPDPDRTAGVLIGRRANGEYVILHAVAFHGTPAEVRDKIRRMGQADLERFGDRYTLALEVDPGQAGVSERMYLGRELAGLPIRWVRPWGKKEKRVEPLSAAVEAGAVRVVKGPWLTDYFRELEAFPEGTHDDLVDASSLAFHVLTSAAPRWEVHGEEA